MDEARFDALERKVLALQKRVALLSSRATLEEPIPDTDCKKGEDPKTCPFASTYQYQKGCKGAACKHKNAEFYSNKRAAARTPKVADTPVKVAPAKKKLVKR